MTININELRPAVGAAGLNAISMQEVLEILDRLEAAESVLKDFGTTTQEVECWLERYRCLEREAEALRARIEAMEKQKPVGTLHDDGCFVWSTPRPYESNYVGWKMKLYALPGAQAQNAPKTVAYLDLGVGGYMDIGTDLTDEELATLPKGRHMLGVVGTYGVAGYVPTPPAPSVPEGWKLVPTAESRHPGIYKMLSALHAVDNTPGASEWASYAAFLAAAPEAKP